MKKRRSEFTLDCVQCFHNTFCRFVLHFSHQFVPRLPLRQNKKYLFVLLCPLNAVHLPMPEDFAHFYFRGTLFNACPARCLCRALAFFLSPFVFLDRQIFIGNRQKNALIDIAIQSRPCDFRVFTFPLFTCGKKRCIRGILFYADHVFQKLGVFPVFSDL